LPQPPPIDLSRLRIAAASARDREFSYRVKKLAEGDYITELWGWDEAVQRQWHDMVWQTCRPSLITYDGQPIGTIAVSSSDPGIEIGQFFILPEFQRKGIGTFLLSGILEKADREGKTAHLAYLRNNPAESLYLRLGFIIVRQEESFRHMERAPRPPVSA